MEELPTWADIKRRLANYQQSRRRETEWPAASGVTVVIVDAAGIEYRLLLRLDSVLDRSIGGAEPATVVVDREGNAHRVLLCRTE